MTEKHTRPLLNISKSILDTTYLALTQEWSLWENSLGVALRHISEELCDTLHVARVSIWANNQQQDGFELLDMYQRDRQQHSHGTQLLFSDYPAYLDALTQDRVIDAVDAHSDYRTREFSEHYLTPNGIGSMLDATLRKAGQLSGVLCIEHVGGQRLWNEHEKRFAISVADLISQRLIHEDIRNTARYYRELSSLHQAIFNGASYSIISTRIDGTIDAFNDAAARMLGYSSSEVIDQATPLLFHDVDQIRQRAETLSQELGEPVEANLEALFARARRGIADEQEWTYIRKDGSRLPILLSTSALTDNDDNITGFLGIAFDITDRVLTQRALREEEARYRLLFESAGDSIFLMKGDLFIDCNSATLNMFGCRREQIINQPPYRFSPEFQPDGSTSMDKALEKINAAFAGETQFFEWQHLTYSGSPFDAEVTLNTVKIQDQPHLLATVRDISDRKSAERELKKSRRQLLHRNENLSLINQLANRLHGSHSVDTIFEDTLQALLGLTDTPLVAIYLKDDQQPLLRLMRSYGFDEAAVQTGLAIPLDNSISGLALKAGQIMVSRDFASDERVNERIKRYLQKHTIQAGVVIPLIYQELSLGTINLLYRNNREFSAVELETFEAIGNAVSLALANARHMITLKTMAHHDSLTGLPNRSLLHEHFHRRLNNTPSESAVLLLLDLDRFKEINDTLGHHIGDKLLQQIGPRLSSLDTGYDTLLCRLGGDEFTIVMYDITDNADIHRYTELLLEALRKPFAIDAMVLEIDVSIGVAVYPADGKNSHALLRSADVAMYEAKRKGGGICRYNRSADKHTPERLALIAELGTAIREGQLLLHFQPKVDLISAQVTGFEALVRWQHPHMGLLYPDKFMHLAEVSDTIHLLTQAVLEQALAQQQQWRAAGYGFSVAINLSARNLGDDRCISYIENKMQQYGTEPGMLELEITETALMHDPGGAALLLNRLSALGVKIAIDDFGTGYSSLSYLRKLPIDALKIDREFVAEMLNNEQDSIIVRSTIALAHNLNMKVVAEGVENEATMKILDKMGCDQVQGYYISRPADWDTMQQWLAISAFSDR
jgi:diguanylate cyclase (GGDEF)-like protein/PAS domain S-box-containing protein